jgi:hypothetical protein
MIFDLRFSIGNRQSPIVNLLRACNVRQTEEKWVDFQRSAFHYSLVSEQQKLCQQQPAKAQASADAPLDGPQSRLAPITIFNLFSLEMVWADRAMPLIN